MTISYSVPAPTNDDWTDTVRLGIATARRFVAATALAGAAVLMSPLMANATPASPAAVPRVDKRVLDSLGAFVPAIIGSVATPGPDGKMNADLLRQARTLAASNQFPPQARQILNTVIDFLQQDPRQAAAKGAPDIPTGPHAPIIQQFLYPTVGVGCIPGGNSVGTALVTAGPQEAPAPGPKYGQAGYVYTSLGTGPAFNSRSHPLVVSWINIDNGRTGQMNLLRNNRINASSGPGTFTGIATTGRGRVLSAIYGNVTTTTKGKVIGCTIVPTVGIAYI